MSVPPVLNVHRHDTDNRAPVTLTGEIDLKSAPLVHASQERRLHDSIHTIDVDGTVTAGGSLQLHHPSPALEHLVALTGADRAFAFTGILVRPRARNRDVARRLQERLLAEHQTSLGVTLADRADQPVPAALRSRGWKDVGDVRRSADGAVFLAPALPSGLRTAARLKGLDHHAWTRWSP